MSHRRSCCGIAYDWSKYQGDVWFVTSLKRGEKEAVSSARSASTTEKLTLINDDKCSHDLHNMVTNVVMTSTVW
jgi:hypothetical protein